MKKLLSILLATAFLLCAGLLPVSAENITDKDDSRIDIGEIFGYYYTVTFVEGDTENTADFEHNTEISYPALTPVRGEDYVWSASANEYSPVPTLMPEEDITVYAYKFPYVGFENYPSDATSSVVGVSTDYAYKGENSLKYFNSQSENRKHSIALGNATAGTAYRISFKYFVPAALNANYTVTPFTGYSDIETDKTCVDYTASEFSINADVKTGEWLDGAVYFTADENIANDHSYIYLWLKANSYNNGDAIYFDNVTTEEMVTANFVINENVLISSKNGVLDNNVFTAYYESGEEITAPNATTVDGAPVVWIDANGNIATEFAAGGVYLLKLDSKGDLNMDGAVSTIDLSLLKLYIVESIDGSSFNVTNADIVANGKIDIVDMAYLKLYLAGVVEL